MQPAADPAAELMKLGQAKVLGAVNHHHRGVRHIHPDFNHRGRNENVGIPFGKGLHGGFFFF